MAAAHKNPTPRTLPLQHGLLHASAETIEGPRPSDWCDIFVDELGDLVLLLLDVRSSAESSDEFPEALLRSARKALLAHDPLHTVVNGVEMQLATHPGVEAGLAILRFSQRDAKVEVLNAGMPAVANAGPSGRLELYPALSGPVGRRVGEVHPYELVALVWGSTWVAVSDGMMNGSMDPQNVAAMCAKRDLSSEGINFAKKTGEELYDSFQGLLSGSRFLRDDATVALVAADGGARFQSGITRS